MRWLVRFLLSSLAIWLIRTETADRHIEHFIILNVTKTVVEVEYVPPGSSDLACEICEHVLDDAPDENDH